MLHAASRHAFFINGNQYTPHRHLQPIRILLDIRGKNKTKNKKSVSGFPLFSSSFKTTGSLFRTCSLRQSKSKSCHARTHALALTTRHSSVFSVPSHPLSPHPSFNEVCQRLNASPDTAARAWALWLKSSQYLCKDDLGDLAPWFACVLYIAGMSLCPSFIQKTTCCRNLYDMACLHGCCTALLVW